MLRRRIGTHHRPDAAHIRVLFQLELRPAGPRENLLQRKVGAVVDKVLDGGTELMEAVGGAVGSVVSSVGDVVGGAGNDVVGAVGSVLDAVGSAVKSVME